MRSRVPVHVHATDSITKFGLSAQVGQAGELMLVDMDRVDAESVVILAADVIEDENLRIVRELGDLGCRHFILVSSGLDETSLRAVVDVGVCGIIARGDVTPFKLAQMAVKAKQGEATLPAEVLAKLLKQVSNLEHNVTVPGPRYSGLTTRESQVLRLVADGLDTNEIAEKLAYSSRTVKNILHGIITRFCLRNRSHAVAYAMREGLI